MVTFIVHTAVLAMPYGDSWLRGTGVRTKRLRWLFMPSKKVLVRDFCEVEFFGRCYDLIFTERAEGFDVGSKAPR